MRRPRCAGAPLRIGFFGQVGPYAPAALEALLADRSGRFCVPYVVAGCKRPPGRRTLRVMPPPTGATRGSPEDLVALAHFGGATAMQTCDVNGAAERRALAAAQLDVLVCVGFDRLFSPGVLDCFDFGLNAHPSPLPAWRGPSPLFWQARQGVAHSAVTLHVLDAREDHGPLVAQAKFALPPRATGDALFRLAGAVAGRLLVEHLGRAHAGALHAQPQDHARATRAPRPRAEDVCIQPEHWRAEHLMNFACAAPYFRTPWLHLGGDTFFVRRGIRVDVGARLPGEFVSYGNCLAVACQDGVVHLEVQD